MILKSHGAVSVADGSFRCGYCFPRCMSQRKGNVSARLLINEWTFAKMYAILRKEIYKGTLVRQTRNIPKAEQLRFENVVPTSDSEEV